MRQTRSCPLSEIIVPQRTAGVPTLFFLPVYILSSKCNYKLLEGKGIRAVTAFVSSTDQGI